MIIIILCDTCFLFQIKIITVDELKAIKNDFPQTVIDKVIEETVPKKMVKQFQII